MVHGLVSGPVTSVSGWWAVPGLFVSTPSAKLRAIATWAYSTSYLVPVNGSITGEVKENGVALPYCTVCIYYRQNGFLIARTKTDANGEFTFYDLDPTPLADADDARYFIVALDPNGGVLYNAQIFDRLLAV